MITTLKVLFFVKKFKFFFFVLKNIPVFGFCVCVCMCGCAIFKTIFNVYPFIVVEKSEFFFLRFNTFVCFSCLSDLSLISPSHLFFFCVYRPKKNLHDYRFFQWIIGSFVSVSLSSSLCPWIIVFFLAILFPSFFLPHTMTINRIFLFQIFIYHQFITEMVFIFFWKKNSINSSLSTIFVYNHKIVLD